MHDYYTGIDPDSIRVTADFELDGAEAGTNLADRFAGTTTAQGVREWKLKAPIEALEAGTLTVSVKDRQGNTTTIVRGFWVEKIAETQKR